jgi:hypothetical protein
MATLAENKINDETSNFKYGPTINTVNAKNNPKNKGININANGIKFLKFSSKVSELVIQDNPLK